jgi:exopolysaccharide production protein ExoQ
MHLPPQLASFLTWAFIIFLFRRDIRKKPNITGALWIPLIWFLIITTRAISEWLNLFGLHMGAVTLEEGSPLDACVYFVLIAGGLYVLHQRQASLSEIVRNNQWLTIFLLYCFVSIVWSDFPFVAFKRWIKILGHPVMALIILTEPDPEEALTRLMKRCAYVIVPISILFIKYYPQLGRGFDPWSGGAVNTGVTTNKNALGYDCLILGFFFFWHLLNTWRTERSITRRNELLLTIGFLAAIWWWLFSMAHSLTPLMSLLLGVAIMAALGLRFVNKRLIGTYVVAGIVICVLVEATFGISGRVIELLGKSPTLTDRTVLWEEVLKVKINPIFGAGFESFWLGERYQKFGESRWWQPNQAHNGYLETYLNLGLVGLFLLVGLLIATFWKSRRELLRNFEFGRFRLGFLAAVVVYNWTEASFKALHPVWFVFYLIALDYPKVQSDSVQSNFETTEPEEERELTFAQSEI